MQIMQILLVFVLISLTEIDHNKKLSALKDGYYRKLSRFFYLWWLFKFMATVVSL